MIILIFSYFKY